MKPFRLIYIISFISVVFIINLYSYDDLDKGIQLLKSGEYAEAKEYFIDMVTKNEKDADANYYLGRTYLVLDDYDKAIKYLDTAIELDNNVADYHFYLGHSLRIKAQNSNLIKQALLAPDILKEFERTVEIDSTHVPGHIGIASFYLSAPSFMGGDLLKAQREADILLRLGEKQGQLILIGVYEKENKTELAEEEYEKYHKSFNDSTDSYVFYNGYGYFLLRQKKYDKAIEMFEKQVTLAPDQVNPHDSLGDALREAGKLEEALAEYQKALAIDPGFKISRNKAKELHEKIRRDREK